jgi:hypothetical protein
MTAQKRDEAGGLFCDRALLETRLVVVAVLLCICVFDVLLHAVLGKRAVGASVIGDNELEASI